MIIAICISAIGAGQLRMIKDLTVYYITVVFSLLAYGWMYIVLVVVSEDLVEICFGSKVWPVLLGFVGFKIFFSKIF